VRGAKGIRTLTFENVSEAHRELLRFGAGVEVLQPEELRIRVAETAREVASLYGLGNEQ
jgi:predicted DNA-binding transcriptional regulator YafY